jgi:pyruvate/2-oxoglutarate dehydrogenase complex dihydrolipoamide dehydrogenase (E3) component
VIAPGRRPHVPPIPGLDQVPYFTTETLFENAVLPQHLLIIGGGPVGTEMAQAHRRLGAEVTLLARGALLPRDDPDAVDVLRQALLEDGIALHESADELRITRARRRISASFSGHDGARRELEATHVLVAAGRRPNIEGLDLEAAGVLHSEKGIEVDARLRTSNRRIYAAGDVAGGPQFTHLAAYHARIVLRNALFRLPAKANLAALPWVTYTDPELAQVGLTEAQARKAHGSDLRVLTTRFADIDRAQTDSAQRGFAKILVTKRGRVVGATIVGRQAGELLVPWGLAVAGNFKIGTLARTIVSYPSLSEITKRAASTFYTPALFSARTRWLVRILGWFG